MPTLSELKNKWFIPMDGSAADGIPSRRHTEDAGPNALEVSTDGNIVTPLIDGQVFMQAWRDDLVALHGKPNAELFHAGWRFEDVRTLGHTVATSGALDVVNDADNNSVTAIVMICRNLMVVAFNAPTVAWLRLHLVFTSAMDNRFPPAGSNHQKFAVMKQTGSASTVLGSIDISRTRWDRTVHAPADVNRNPIAQPTHDTGVKITGPAVADVEKTYRERWNDSTRVTGLVPTFPQPLISSPIATSAGGGTHSVQVLRTYGITRTLFGYSWSPRGEFTVWASYLNAIKGASQYIFIEDQYFLPFDWPPCHTRTGLARDTDVIYQLGEAIKRGVQVVVVTPSNDEDATHMYQKYQRDIGVNYLNGVAAAATGDIVVASLQNSGTDIYVHSKLMICDDEFVLIGSTNVGQRSMAHDGEIHVGVVDSANVLAKDMRKTIWAEHTSRSAASLDNPVTAFTQFKADTAASHGHLQPYPVDSNAVYPATATSTQPPSGHSRIIRTLVDPYAGPAGIR